MKMNVFHPVLASYLMLTKFTCGVASQIRFSILTSQNYRLKNAGDVNDQNFSSGIDKAHDVHHRLLLTKQEI